MMQRTACAALLAAAAVACLLGCAAAAESSASSRALATAASQDAAVLAVGQKKDVSFLQTGLGLRSRTNKCGKRRRRRSGCGRRRRRGGKKVEAVEIVKMGCPCAMAPPCACPAPVPCSRTVVAQGDDDAGAEGILPDGSVKLGPPPGLGGASAGGASKCAGASLLETSETTTTVPGQSVIMVPSGVKGGAAAGAGGPAEAKLAADRAKAVQLASQVAQAQSKLDQQVVWWKKAKKSLKHIKKLIARSQKSKAEIQDDENNLELQRQILRHKMQKDVLERDLRVAKFVAAKVGKQWADTYLTRKQLAKHAARIATQITKTHAQLLNAIKNYQEVSEAGKP